jgi:hypothetical protein
MQKVVVGQLATSMGIGAIIRFIGPYYGQFVVKSVIVSILSYLVPASVLFGLLIKNSWRPTMLLISSLLLAFAPIFAYFTRDYAFDWGPENVL